MPRLLRILVATALLGLGPATGGAQQLDPDRLARVLDMLTDPEIAAADIGRQVTACLTPLAADSPEHAPILIAVDFDAAGAPQPPRLLAPTETMAERIHLRQLIRAENAFFDCAPLDVGGSPVIDAGFNFLVENDRIEVWDGAAPEMTAPAAPPLALSRSDAREMQVRLRLAGHDPGGADGVLGPRSRAAITDWQRARGYSATGSLDGAQYEALKQETSTAYRNWLTTRPAPPKRRAVRGRDGCLRYASGRIVPGQSLNCDVKGLIQSF